MPHTPSTFISNSNQPRSNTTSMANQSFSDMLFGFAEDEDDRHQALASPEFTSREQEEESSDNEEAEAGFEKDHSTFWENQNQILQATVRRTSSVERGIRKAVKEAMESSVCGCGASEICRSRCVMRQITARLTSQGYDSAICHSKWRTSQDLPSGEHTFVDVVDKSSSKRVIVEVNLRGEFEMARASDDYKRLLRHLPELFVGKPERLQALIKTMCAAAKRCMKERKMHMGPWRKHRYMHAKWLGPCRRTPSVGPADAAAFAAVIPRPPRAKAASMLTVDLLDYSSMMHCKVVTVV